MFSKKQFIVKFFSRWQIFFLLFLTFYSIRFFCSNPFSRPRFWLCVEQLQSLELSLPPYLPSKAILIVFSYSNLEISTTKVFFLNFQIHSCIFNFLILLSYLFRVMLNAVLVKQFKQWRAYAFSSMFILDVAPKSQKDHKLFSAPYILCIKNYAFKR